MTAVSGMRLLKEVEFPKGIEGEQDDASEYFVEVDEDPQLIHEGFLLTSALDAAAVCKLNALLSARDGPLRRTGDASSGSGVFTLTNFLPADAAGVRQLTVQVAGDGDGGCGGYVTLHTRWRWDTG